MSEPTNDDGWIVHDGGPCPVPADAMVVVRFRDGYVEDAETAWFWSDKNPADEFDYWKWQGLPDWNIVAYRLIEPARIDPVSLDLAPDPRDARIAELTAERDELTKRLADAEAAHRRVVVHNSRMALEWAALVSSRSAGSLAAWAVSFDSIKAERDALAAQVAMLREAIGPIRHYVACRDAKPLRNLGEHVHSIHGGTEYDAMLTMAHLRAVLAATAPRPAPVIVEE